MNIQVNTDNHIHSDERLISWATQTVEVTFSHFAERITTIKIHFSDVNAGKGGNDDKYCNIEARLEGLRPLVVTHAAANLKDALHGATEKLDRLIEHTLGRLETR